jgi:hypothetical protein
MKRSLFILPIIILFIGCEKPFDSGDDNTVNEENVYFDANGGEHTYSNGITRMVPPGALTEGRYIYIRDLRTDETTSLLTI